MLRATEIMSPLDFPEQSEHEWLPQFTPTENFNVLWRLILPKQQ